MARDARNGGQVTGPGTWNSDNVEIKASPGEEVIPGAVVAYYGQKFFDDLINNAVQKTGLPRGADQSGRPPSPAAQASFAQHQEPDADDRGGAPDGDADDMGEQPEASNPRPSVQGRPLRAAGPTMGGQQMAEGGEVKEPLQQPAPAQGKAPEDPTAGMNEDEKNNYAGLLEHGMLPNESRYHATNPSGRLFPPGTRDPWEEREMAKGGVVEPNFGGKPLSQHADSELPHLARARRNSGDLAGHRAVLAEINRRTNPARMALGGDVPSVSIPGGASPQVGRKQGGGRGLGSVAIGGAASPASRFNGPSGGGGGIRVPQVHVPSAPLSPKPVINAPAAMKPIATPNPPAVEAAGPPTAAAPAAAPIVQRSTAPRISNLGVFAHPPGAAAPATAAPTQPRSPLAMIGRAR